MVVTVAEPIRGLVEAIGRAMTGDFAGAGAAIVGIGKNISGAWGQAFDVMADKAQATRDRIWNLFATPTDAAGPSGEGKSAAGLVKPEKEVKGKQAKKEADPSFMPYYEAALAERKRLASEEDALREYTKAEELAYWQSLLDAARLHGKDRVAIEKKVSDLTVQVRREEAKEKLALDAEVSRNRDAMAMGRVDAAQAAAQAALDMEQITKVQMAALEIDYENQRWAIQKASQAERIALAEADPNASPAELARVKNQLLEIEQRHQIALTTLIGKYRTQQVAQTMQMWSSLSDRMSGLWDKGIQAMMNGTLRWRNAFRAIGTELVGWFANNVVGAMLKDWIAGEMKKLAMKLGFLGQEKGAQVTASGEIMGTKGAEATAVAGANAVEAGTGAAAAVAPIPFIGPVMALAAMASVFAAVMAMSSRKSAARGYDIPKGLNPLVQTHEEEMILPSEHANTMRRLAEMEKAGALGGSGGGSNVVNYHDHSGRLSNSEIRRKAGVIAKELNQRVNRDFWRPV